MIKSSRKRRTIGFVVLTMSFLALAWIACSNAAPYGGGGRDLGPQGMPMGTSEAGSDGDSGVKVDTGVDMGVTDTGTGG